MYPSIAANANDDVCIGFTRSDATRFAEAAFTGRLGTDPPGATDPIQRRSSAISMPVRWPEKTESAAPKT